MSALAFSRDSPAVRATPIVAILVGILVLMGSVRAESIEQFLAYLLILSAALLPGFLWLRMGAPGIPVLPMTALAHILFFAWPVVSANEGTLAYTRPEILRASLTVALFLIIATATWRAVLCSSRPAIPLNSSDADGTPLVQFLFVGLFVGIFFHVAIVYGWLAGLGSLFGLVRSIAITTTTIACFMIGVARAWGILRGGPSVAALAGLSLLILVSFSSLFLFGGIMYAAAAALGYIIVTRRIPWPGLAAVIVAVSVLHAGKAEMRAKYWEPDSNYGGASSALQLPGLMAEWIGEGIRAIATGESGPSPLERASLMHVLLLAQAETPENVDYLMGETYAYLPGIVLPRFVDSDKPASQVGMDLLNLHYGLLTVEGAETTAIGWGLIAEAFANFGYPGVVGIALVLGLLCGALANWDRHRGIFSVPTFVSIAAMMTLLNLEADFILLSSTLLQSIGSVLILSAACRWLVTGQRGN